MKRVLPVRDVKQLLDACDAEHQPQEFYANFCRALDKALENTADTVEHPPEEGWVWPTWL